MSKIPGFSARASLYRSGGHYYSSISYAQTETGLAEMAIRTDIDLTGNEITAAWPWDCPTIRSIGWEDFNRVTQQCNWVCDPYWDVCYYCEWSCDNYGNCVDYCYSEPCQECNWIYQCQPVDVPLPDGDIIRVTIESNAVSQDVVEFVLALGGNVTWKKVLNMPDGQGNSWDIVAEGQGASASNSLWAHQVLNGQVLTFSKPKFFGKMCSIYTLGGLERLQPGSRVTFLWVRD